MSRFLWAPPEGSCIILSITSIFNISLAVSLSADAASTVFELSFHKIEEQPSGEITEYIEFKYDNILPQDIKTKAENRRLIDWFDNKFYREVTKIIINERVEKRFRSVEKGGGLPNTELIRLAINTMNNHLKYMEYLLERRFWLVTNKIELADLTAASHISCLDYLGDIPWEKFPEIKLWYSRIKSRQSFRSILTDKIVGIPPRGNYALLDF